MKKKQKINKAVNHGERLLLGLTALFLCLLFVLRERPAPARGISVRTSAARVPDAVPASVPDAPPDAANSPDAPPDSDSASGGPDAAAPESVPVLESDSASDSDALSGSAAPSDDSDGGRVNLNTADLSELCALPGVGESLAARIIDYREQHGPFARPEDVMRVSGIGEGKFAAMQGLITV